MKKRAAIRLLLVIAGLAVAGTLVLRTPWAAAHLCARAESVLGRVTGRPVGIGRCTIEPLRLEALLTGLRIGGAPGEPDALSIERLRLRMAPLPAIAGTLLVDELEIDTPVVRLHAGGGPSGPPAADDCLDVLERVRIGTLVVNGGDARVGLPGGEELQLSGASVRARRRSGGYDLTANVTGGGFARGGAQALTLSSLVGEARFVPGEAQLSIARLDLATSAGRLFAGGELRTLCTPELGLRVVADTSLADVVSLAGLPLTQPRGTISLDAQLRGPLAAPQGSANVQLRGIAFDDLAPGDLDAAFTLDAEQLSIDELTWPIEKGRAKVRGTIARDEQLTTVLDVRTEALEFHRLLARLPIKNTPVRMVVDSTHHLEGRLRGGLVLEGRSDLEVHDFEVRSGPWHQEGTRQLVTIVGGRARIETPIRITPSGVELPTARVTLGPGTVIDCPARFGYGTTLELRPSTDDFELEHLGARVAGLHLSGRGRVFATIGGSYDDVRIDGGVELVGARFMATELGDVRARVRATPEEETLEILEVEATRGAIGYGGDAKIALGGDEPVITARFHADRGGRLADGFGAATEAASIFGWLERNLDGRIDAVEARIDGRVTALRIDGSIAASDVRFVDRPFDRLTTGVTFDGTTLRLPGLTAKRGAGVMSGDAEIEILTARPAAELPFVTARMEAKALPLGDLLRPAEPASVEGRLDGAIEARGPIERLDVEGRLEASQVVLQGVPLPPSSLTLTPATPAGFVHVVGPAGGLGRVDARVRVAEGFAYEAEIGVDVPDLRRWQPPGALEPTGGAIAGRIVAAGSLADPARSHGEVTLSRLALSRGLLAVESAEPVRGRFDGGAIEVERLVVRGENTELALRGRKAADGALDLQADGRIDGRIVDTILPWLEHSTGTIDLKAAVTGTSERPQIVGSARLSQGSFRVRPLPIQVGGLTAQLTFSQSQVVIEDATFGINQGKGVARGTVRLGAGGVPEGFDVAVELERASWRLPDDWPATISGKMTLGGTLPDDLVLGGQIVIDRLRYVKDLDLERAVFDFSKRLRQAPPADVREFLKLDLALVGGADMRIENNLVRAKLQFSAPPGSRDGRLQLVGTNVRLGLLGAVELVDAEAVFRGNEYRVTQGIVEFESRDRIDPVFDVTAETEVRTYRVQVRAVGRLPEPGASDRLALVLSSEPPLPQADVLTLLTFGVTSRDTAVGNAALGAGVAAEALLAVSGLDEQMKRFLPESKVLQDPELSVTSQYSEITGQLEAMAVFEAKVFSDRLRLRAATPFATSKGRRASAEVRLDEHVSAQLIWENEETGYSAGDVGADMKLRWEWE